MDDARGTRAGRGVEAAAGAASRRSPTRSRATTAVELAGAARALRRGAGADRRDVGERDDGALARALADDELVAHLLLLHGLHPVPLEERVREALDEVRPYLDSHGGDVELLGVEDGVVRLRLQGSCSGCPSSAVTLKLAIEDAIHRRAPEVEASRPRRRSRRAAARLLQIELAPAAARRPSGAWATAGGLPELAGGGTAAQGRSPASRCCSCGSAARTTPTGRRARPARRRSRTAS